MPIIPSSSSRTSTLNNMQGHREVGIPGLSPKKKKRKIFRRIVLVLSRSYDSNLYIICIIYIYRDIGE